jgi:hypothetical protein
VQPSGTVIVPINGFAGVNFLMVAFTSTDGGASWSKTNIIARVGFHHAAGGIRDSIPLPWPRWTSKLMRLPLDPVGSGVDHFIPGLAVDPTTSGSSAHLLLTFYYYPNANCTADTCQLDVGYSSSADGGASWTPTTQIAGPMTLSWLPDTTEGTMVGDYISTSFSGGPAYPAFADATAPTSGRSDCATATPNSDEATFTVNGACR